MNRAVYHRADIFMLDDVLSAVDAQVARWILSNAILSPLVNQHTRVLCTHNIQVLSLYSLVSTIMSLTSKKKKEKTETFKVYYYHVFQNNSITHIAIYMIFKCSST